MVVFPRESSRPADQRCTGAGGSEGAGGGGGAAVAPFTPCHDREHHVKRATILVSKDSLMRPEISSRSSSARRDSVEIPVEGGAQLGDLELSSGRLQSRRISISRILVELSSLSRLSVTTGSVTKSVTKVGESRLRTRAVFSVTEVEGSFSYWISEIFGG